MKGRYIANRLKQLSTLTKFALGDTNTTRGPIKASLELTYRCNSKCRTCRRWRIKDYKNELSTDKWIKLLDELKEVNTLFITITGGEPFLRKDIFKIIKYAKKLGMTVGVITNGLLVEEMIDKIIDSNLDILHFSVESSNSKIHDSIRGVSGGFEKTISAVNKLIKFKKRPKIYFTMTLNSRNISEILNMANLVQQLGVESLDICLAHTIDKHGLHIDKKLIIPQNKIPELQEQINILFKKYPNILAYPKIYYDEFKTFLETPKKLYKYKCCSCVYLSYITRDGNVLLCPPANKPVGSIKNKSFKEIWFSKEANKERKKFKKGCPYNICWLSCFAPINIIFYMLPRPWLWHKFLDRGIYNYIARYITKK